MRGLKRVFYDGELKDVIELPEDTSRRLKTVLRLEQGDRVEILASGKIASGEIAMAGKRSLLVKIESRRPARTPDYSFTVYQCLAKREYMDVMVEKYAELGATSIVPVLSARSVGEIKETALARFSLIAREAALQSENEFIAKIEKPVHISKIKAIHGDNLLFHERNGEKSLPALKTRDIGMVIGPEGGFEEKEREALISAGFRAYTPIGSILKAETAAAVFSGFIRAFLG